MLKTYLLALVPCLALLAACSSDGIPGTPNTGGAGSTAGAAGQLGTAGAAGTPVGSAGASGAGTAGSSGSNTAGASGGSVGGAGGAGGAGGGSSAGAGGMSGGGGAPGKVRTGKSAGCGKAPPAGDLTTKYVTHEVSPKNVAAKYLKGGAEYKFETAKDGSGKTYDFSIRPYGIRLPNNYNNQTAYKVTFGGGGCGGNAIDFGKNPNGGNQLVESGTTIQVGLAYIGGCFDDEGVDTPDEPYFRAVMADLEANYCFDLSQVFVGGSSSGAWEAYMLGCAASDLVRGIGAMEGGARIAHPVCKNPVAAVLVAGEADTENPIGPLDPTKDAGKRLGSYGSGPSKDDILKRNGCVGTASEKLNDKYSACVKYTGCPAAYPVVWCVLPGLGHGKDTYNNVDYNPGPMWDVLNALPPP